MATFIQKIINKFKILKAFHKLEDTIESLRQDGGVFPLNAQYKQNNIKEYAEYYDCKIFVETGTYLGDTTNAVKNYFEKLYTIELSEELYKDIKERFKNEPLIECHQGDSKDVLKEILPKIDKKCLFWLDAHYSAGITAKGDKDTPILEELEIIFNSNIDAVILIDDARCFGTLPDYPTKFTLKNFVRKYRPNAEIEIYDDIIRIV